MYFRWFETVHIKYLQQIGIMLDGNANDPKGAIIARSECNFLRPIKYPDTITVCCSAVSVGNSSINLEYRVRSEALGEGECATGSSTLVMFDYVAGKPCPLGPEIVERMNRLEGLEVPVKAKK